MRFYFIPFGTVKPADFNTLLLYSITLDHIVTSFCACICPQKLLHEFSRTTLEFDDKKAYLFPLASPHERAISISPLAIIINSSSLFVGFPEFLLSSFTDPLTKILILPCNGVLIITSPLKTNVNGSPDEGPIIPSVKSILLLFFGQFINNIFFFHDSKF